MINKKIASFLLACVMLLSLTPSAAYAVDLDIEPMPSDPPEAAELLDRNDASFQAAAEEPSEDDGQEESLSDNGLPPADSPEESEPVRLVFRCGQAADLRDLHVFNADGEEILPCYDEELGDYLYGQYELLPGEYRYSFRDSQGRFEEIAETAVVLSADEAQREIELALTEVEQPEKLEQPEETTSVFVSFTCEQTELAGLHVYDAEGVEIAPLADKESGEPLYGEFLLVPGAYTYSYHDDNAKYEDLSDSFALDGSESQEITLILTPSPIILSFSETFINPIYSDVIREEDLPEVAISTEQQQAELKKVAGEDASGVNTRRRFRASPFPAGSTVFTDVESAGSMLKSKLLSRESLITVYFKTKTVMDEAAWKDYVHRIFAAAIAHTGVSTEGDYIRYEFGGYKTEGGSIYSADSSGDCYFSVTYAPLYFTTAEQEKELTQKVNAILDSLALVGKSNYQKLSAIYTYLCNHISYLQGSSSDIQYTAYGALINGSAVCQGYAVALYRLCLESGIDTRIITCSNMRHAWNIVQMDGSYYAVDVTWDSYQSTAPDFKFLLKGRNTWLSKHLLNGVSEIGDEYADTAFAAKYPIPDADYKPAEEESVHAVIHSVSVIFEGQIRIKYYLVLPDELKADSGAHAAFFVGGEQRATAPVSAAPADSDKTLFYYNVVAEEIGQDVTIKLFDGSGNVYAMKSGKGTDYTDTGFTYSVGRYAADKAVNGQTKEMRDLAAALGDYGTAAQIYFKSGDYQSLAVSDRVAAVTAGQMSDYALSTEGTRPTGLKTVWISVMFEEDNALRVYFSFENGKKASDYSFQIDGSSANIQQRSDGANYLVVKNIAAKKLGEPHSFTISDGNRSYTIHASAISYAQSIIQNSSNPASRDLGRALYLYFLAADAYFPN